MQPKSIIWDGELKGLNMLNVLYTIGKLGNKVSVNSHMLIESHSPKWQQVKDTNDSRQNILYNCWAWIFKH